MAQNNYPKGVVALIFAALFYGWYGVLSRIVGVDFGVFFQTAVRGLLVAILLLPIIIWHRRWPALRTGDIRRFLALGISSVISFSAVFIAFNFLPIGFVLLVFYASVTISGYGIGHLFFNERLTPRKLLALIIALIGLLFLYFTIVDPGKIWYSALPVITGVSTACWYALSKKLANRYTAPQIFFVDQIIVTTISSGLAILLREPLSSPTFSILWLAILAFAVITIAADVLAIYGFRLLSIQTASIALLLEAIFGALFGWLFFGEAITLAMAVGGLMILIGIAISYKSEVPPNAAQ
ncbi:MAG: DMT family transporter [Patescibacteria group bacterium]|nr:DMT family transporter [Patescibacteria group bacterium]